MREEKVINYTKGGGLYLYNMAFAQHNKTTGIDNNVAKGGRSERCVCHNKEKQLNNEPSNEIILVVQIGVGV